MLPGLRALVDNHIEGLRVKRLLGGHPQTLWPFGPLVCRPKPSSSKSKPQREHPEKTTGIIENTAVTTCASLTVKRHLYRHTSPEREREDDKILAKQRSIQQFWEVLKRSRSSSSRWEPGCGGKCQGTRLSQQRYALPTFETSTSESEASSGLLRASLSSGAGVQRTERA